MWTCPKCERSLKSPNQWHNCVQVSIDSLFEGKKPELVFIFDALLLEIIDWQDVAVSATQNCIVFVHRQTFLIIRPMKWQLDLKFYSAAAQNEFPILKSIAYSGKFENHIRLADLDEVNPAVFNFIRTSYELL